MPHLKLLVSSCFSRAVTLQAADFRCHGSQRAVRRILGRKPQAQSGSRLPVIRAYNAELPNFLAPGTRRRRAPSSRGISTARAPRHEGAERTGPALVRHLRARPRGALRTLNPPSCCCPSTSSSAWPSFFAQLGAGGGVQPFATLRRTTNTSSGARATKLRCCGSTRPSPT